MKIKSTHKGCKEMSTLFRSSIILTDSSGIISAFYSTHGEYCYQIEYITKYFQSQQNNCLANKKNQTNFHLDLYKTKKKKKNYDLSENLSGIVQ